MILNGNRIVIPDGLEQSTRRIFNRGTGRVFDATAVDEVTVINLMDEIGYWGVEAKTFNQMLRGAGDIKLRIHSPGGDVYDGICIYNDLLQHSGKVDVEVVGLAASISSLIAMAGDTIKMAPTAYMMIHNAWGMVIGDRHDHADMADILSDIDGTLAGVYGDRGKLKLSEFVDMMDTETWLTADASIDAGLADGMVEAPAELSAKYDLSGFAHPPKEWAQPPTSTEFNNRDFEQLLKREAGLTRSQVADFMNHGFKGMREAAQTGQVKREADDDDYQPFRNLIKELEL